MLSGALSGRRTIKLQLAQRQERGRHQPSLQSLLLLLQQSLQLKILITSVVDTQNGLLKSSRRKLIQPQYLYYTASYKVRKDVVYL